MMKPTERIFGLDILRCFAILTVVYGHIFYVVEKGIASPKFERMFFFDGVNVFFTLSGFLIGSILIRKFTKGLSFTTLVSFWRDRWLRTLPAYFFVLLLLLPTAKESILPYFVFLQNFVTLHGAFFGESWSLTIEEWFYLTAPFLIFIVAKSIPLKKAVPILLIVIFFLANAIRFYKIQHYGYTKLEQVILDVFLTIPCRIDAVMWGVLGAYMNFYDLKIWRNHRNLFFYIGITGFFINHYIMVFNPDSVYAFYIQKQVEAFFVLLTIPKLFMIKQGKGIIAKAVSFIAVISYSIYLVHASIYEVYIKPILAQDFITRLLIYIGWSFAAALVLYSTVEKSGMRLRQYLRHRKTFDAKMQPRSNTVC